jgi:hypothetical protein
MDFNTQNVQKLIQDGLNLNQNCVGSKGQGNMCVFSLNVDQAKVLKEHNINVSQNCGSCKVYDPDNASLGLGTVDCKNLSNSIGNYFANQPSGGGKVWMYVAFGVAVIFVLLIIGIVLYKIL